MDRYEAAARNRRTWDAATAAHERHKAGAVAWLAAGGSTLFPEELELLGDLHGRRVAHLLCNNGHDSLSLVARGAEVTGVDLSEVAVAAARATSAASGLAARFVCADVYDWLADVDPGVFDAVFLSYGAVQWLADLRGVVAGVARLLAPGGRLVIVDVHPLADTLGPDLRPARPYGGGVPFEDPDGVPDYVAESDGLLLPMGGGGPQAPFRNPHPDVTFSWGLGDLVNACVAAGLHVDRLDEHAFTNGWRMFPSMVPAAGRRFVLPEAPGLPLTFGLRALQPTQR